MATASLPAAHHTLLYLKELSPVGVNRAAFDFVFTLLGDTGRDIDLATWAEGAAGCSASEESAPAPLLDLTLTVNCGDEVRLLITAFASVTA